MIDLRKALLDACDAIDSTMGETVLQPHERAAFIMGYLIGGPLEADREVFIRVYNQTPEDASRELDAVDDVTKKRLEKILEPCGIKTSDIHSHLETGYHPKLRLL